MQAFQKWPQKRTARFVRAVLSGVLTIARRHSSFVAIALLLADGAGASLAPFARCSAGGC